jgi:MFS transporter, FSR family, fosmidomycin resistance protein
VLATALAIEALDELVDGTKGAAFPLIRADLRLSYTQVGLLIAMPLLLGGLVELPFGILAGSGRPRNRLVLAGGVAFASSLVVVAFARSFGVLLLGFVAFFPASGAFVSLTQAALMDADPARHQQSMAAWELAGSAGAVAGPLLVAGVLVADGTWRSAYLVLACAALITTAAAAIWGPARLAQRRAARTDTAGPAADADPAARADPDARADPAARAGPAARVDRADARTAGEPGPAGEDDADDRRPTFRQALAAVRDGRVLRWLFLLEVIDLLLDVLTGYVAIYLVDVAHASPALAAIGVAIRLGAGLAGDAIWVAASRVLSGRSALRAGAAAACVLYPAFLLLPWLEAKLAALGALSIVTSCWYPVVQAELYGSLPGRSGIAVFWSSAAGIAGAAGPLAVGVIAQWAGLGWALTCLALAPAVVLALAPRAARRPSLKVKR